MVGYIVDLLLDNKKPIAVKNNDVYCDEFSVAQRPHRRRTAFIKNPSPKSDSSEKLTETNVSA